LYANLGVEVLMEKLELLQQYRSIHDRVLHDPNGLNPRKLGQYSNQLHNELLAEMTEKISLIEDNVTPLLRNYYCYVVSMLETRHRILPYNDIEFSRRVGEVWEKFCNLILQNQFSSAQTIDEPKASDFFQKLDTDINDLTIDGKPQKLGELKDLISSLIGNIDLGLDYFGESNGSVFGIDFKSGFGSNEKGNTERILQVGRAYRYLQPSTKLNVLVRQNENNNYLKKIENSGIWNVETGKNAYLFLENISNCSVISFLETELSFEKDFNAEIFKDIGKTVNNRDQYLNWYS